MFEHELDCGPLSRIDSVQSVVSLLVTPALPPIVRATIRGLDAPAVVHEERVTAETDHLSLSGLGLETVVLAPLQLAPCLLLREISLAGNALETVDLAPLSCCTSLAVLALNNNSLRSINLRSLASCTLLERLWLHDNLIESLDLSPLSSCTKLSLLSLESNALNGPLNLAPLAQRLHLGSLTLSGNSLSRELDITPLLSVPALSVFHVDSSVQLVAKCHPSQARIPPALRRAVLDIKFTVGNSTAKAASPFNRHRLSLREHQRQTRRQRHRTLAAASKPENASPKKPLLPLQILLVAFRLLSRYAAEDALTAHSSCVISRTSQDVHTRNPQLLKRFHVILLHAPTAELIRVILAVCPYVPVVVVATERYKASASPELRSALHDVTFVLDPLDLYGVAEITRVGRDYSSCSHGRLFHARTKSPGRSLDEPDKRLRVRMSKCDIAFPPALQSERPEYVGPLIPFTERAVKVDMWGELAKRPCTRRVGLPISPCIGTLFSTHCRNKSRAERAAAEKAFSDLGGFATSRSCAAIARACGLPVCAGTLLFRAALGAKAAVDLITPEPSIPDVLLEFKQPRKLTVNTFLEYWNARLENFDVETRLCNVLVDAQAFGAELMECTFDTEGKQAEDSAVNGLGHLSDFLGYVVWAAGRFSCTTSAYSDVCFKCMRDRKRDRAINRLQKRASCSALHPRENSYKKGGLNESFTVCAEGVEELVVNFMIGRSPLFGAYSLVKMGEAVAIGTALVQFAIHTANKRRVGGRALPITLSEIRKCKLNTALKAAESGIFEGVAEGLSTNRLLFVKGSFAMEASPAVVSASGGVALKYLLTMEEVKHFNLQRKLLLPGAVHMLFATHCQNRSQMSLPEFAVLQEAFCQFDSGGATDYFFSIIDVDQDDYWSALDVRQFFMERERLLLEDGMVPRNVQDFWVQLCDMVQPKNAARGILRSEFCKLSGKDRQLVIRSLLFQEDRNTTLNICKSMEWTALHD